MSCSECIHECAASRGTCPLCRTKLTSAEIFDAATDEEAAAAQNSVVMEGDYGTKVRAADCFTAGIDALLPPVIAKIAVSV